MEGFCFVPPPPPHPENSSLVSYTAAKNLAFKTPPSPQEFPMTFHGVVMDFFSVSTQSTLIVMLIMVKRETEGDKCLAGR